MSRTDDITRALRVPGRLILAPTDFSAARPHGGTDLGTIEAPRLEIAFIDTPIPAEELGGATSDVHRMPGARAILGFVSRQAKPELIDLLFPGLVTTSTRTGKRIVRLAAGDAPRWLSDDAVSLLHSPDDPIRHDAVWFPRAVPLQRVAWESTRDLGEPGSFVCAFEAIPRDVDFGGANEDRRYVEKALLEDLTLTL
jgi:hypothetical protein